MTAKLRLYSGLILLLFVTGHLANNIAGLHSFEAMDAVSEWTTHPWRTMVGMVILLAAMLIHFFLVQWSLFRRQTLKMKAWEAVQNISGLLIPVFLVGHFVGTKILNKFMGLQTGYAFEMLALFVYAPEFAVVQFFLVLLTWGHGCVGLHTWLRLKPWYPSYQYLGLSMAVGFPALALSGFFAAA